MNERLQFDHELAARREAIHGKVAQLLASSAAVFGYLLETFNEPFPTNSPSSEHPHIDAQTAIVLGAQRYFDLIQRTYISRRRVVWPTLVYDHPETVTLSKENPFPTPNHVVMNTRLLALGETNAEKHLKIKQILTYGKRTLDVYSRDNHIRDIGELDFHFPATDTNEYIDYAAFKNYPVEALAKQQVDFQQGYCDSYEVLLSEFEAAIDDPVLNPR